MLLCTLFLVSLAIIFHSDSSAPEIFGHSIYLVRTDAFSVVEDGSALISRKVPYEEIAPGNIIIFADEKSENAIGEVVEVQSADGVYTFRTRLPSGAEAFVGQSKLIGKGIYISNAIGAVIGFASSPAGVAVIAVLPCSFIIVLEAINIFGGRRKSRVETDKDDEADEDELPAIPKPLPEPPQSRDLSELRSAAPAKKREYTPEETGLFQAPKPGQPVRKPSAEGQRAPISGKELEKIIRETKAEHQREKAQPVQKAAPQVPPAPQPPEPEAKIYTPKKPPVKNPEPAQDSAVSLKLKDSEEKISTLDRLLQEDSSDEHYDIDDILRSLERK